MAENIELTQNVSEDSQVMDTSFDDGSNFDALMAGGDPLSNAPKPATLLDSVQNPNANPPTNQFDALMRAGTYAIHKANEKTPRSLYDTLTYQEAAPPKYIDADSIANFTMQEDYNPNGFNPEDSSNYARAEAKETWGSALSKGMDTMKANFGSSYVDNFVGYKRIGEAVMNMDFSKLEKTEEESMAQYYEMQRDSQKNFVFDTAEGRDSIFSKSSMSEFIGSTGFALGTFGALATEIGADMLITGLTEGAGIGSFAVPFAKIGNLFGRKAITEGAKEGVELGAKEALKTAAEETVKNGNALTQFAEGFTLANKSVEEIRMLRKIEEASVIANTPKTVLRSAINNTFNVFSLNLPGILKSKSVADLVGNVAKGTPLLGTIIKNTQKINAGIEAGLSTSKLVGMGLQGLRRTAQELNMSATEASFEAVTSYGDTLNQLIEDHKSKNEGEIPTEVEFEEMRQTALGASSANFKTNMAVLMLSNQLQFGNIFNRFTSSSKLTRELLDATKDNLLIVEKNNMKKLYEKGFAGAYGLTGQIAEDFGKKEASYQMGKAVFKDMARFELVEGFQENIQNISANGWKDYYLNQYQKSESTLNESFGKALNAEVGKQGVKTFLMGALTGTIIRLPTHIVSKTLEGVNQRMMDSVYKNDPDGNPLTNAKKQFTENVNTMNAFFKSAEERNFKHKIVNFTTQVQEGQNATEAAAKNLQYEFHNSKDNALTSAIIAAKRTETFDIFLRSIKEMGQDMTAEDFEKSFGVKLEDTKYATPSEFSQSLARDVKKYSDTVDGIRQNVKSFAEPYLYKPGSKEQYEAKMLLNSQEDAIHLIGMNAIKGGMTAKRAQEISQDLLSNVHLANSSDYAVRMLTNPEAVNGELGNLMSDAKQIAETLSQSGLDKKTREDLKQQLLSKKEEHKLLEEWLTYFSSKDKLSKEDGEIAGVEENNRDTFVGKRIEKDQTLVDSNGVPLDNVPVTFDTNDKDVMETLNKLLHLKNKEAGVDLNIPTSQMREVHQKLVDYMKLDSDTKDYMSAVDSLMNPEQFKLVQARMASGNMKFNVIKFIEDFNMGVFQGVLQMVENLKSQNIEINETDQLLLYQEVHEYTSESEPYKNLIAFTLDPNLSVQNFGYVQLLVQDLTNVLELKFTELTKRYNPKEYNEDITDDEYNYIISKGELNPIRLNLIADKIARGEIAIGANENKLINSEVFKQAIDIAVEKAKEEIIKEKSQSENYVIQSVDDATFAVLDRATNQPIVEGYASSEEALAAAEELKNTVPVETPDAPTQSGDESIMSKSMRELKDLLSFYEDRLQEAELLEDQEAIDDYNFKIENVQYAINQKNAAPKPIEPTPIVEPVSDKQTDEEGGNIPDQTAELLAMMAANEEREKTFVVETNDAITFDVKDKANNIVTNVATEEKAVEIADSMNNTRKDVDFTFNFISDMIKTEDQQQNLPMFVTQMNTRGKAAISKYNKENEKSIKTLEEFYEVPVGRKKLIEIRESVVTGKRIKSAPRKKITITDDTKNQPLLFDTTTTESPISSKQDVLKLLNDELSAFKDFTKKEDTTVISEKNTKFVVEETVTESSMLAQLKDVAGCFK